MVAPEPPNHSLAQPANAAAPWRPDRLLRGLLAWTSITTLVFWLPLARGACDGPSYAWALGSLGGSGVRGDYWFPILGAAFAIVTLALGWRGAHQPFHWLLLAWHALLTGAALYLAITDPHQFEFRGDTLGISVPLALLGPFLFGIPLLGGIFWVQRDLRRRRPRAAVPWARTNTAILVALLGSVPIQFALLRFGPPGSTADQAGVLLTIAQWLCLGLALRPFAPRAAVP